VAGPISINGLSEQVTVGSFRPPGDPGAQMNFSALEASSVNFIKRLPMFDGRSKADIEYYVLDLREVPESEVIRII
jgi:hypothetical protein